MCYLYCYIVFDDESIGITSNRKSINALEPDESIQNCGFRRFRSHCALLWLNSSGIGTHISNEYEYTIQKNNITMADESNDPVNNNSR